MTRTRIAAVVGVLAVVVAAILVWYVTRPTAEEASVDNALEALQEDDEATETTPTGPATAAAPADVSGTWTVSTDIGTFDFADATSSFVGFRVDEVLTTIGETEAVGRTPAVSGELTIDGTTLAAAMIEADFTQLATDIPRRDRAARRAIGTDLNPTGIFTLTEPVDFGEIPAEGERLTFSAAGELTVNGVTNPLVLELEGQVADGNILVAGSAPVVFADFGVEAPQPSIVASIDDEGTIEVQLWFTRA